MDHQRLVLLTMLILCFLILSASLLAAAATAVDHSLHLHLHHPEDHGLYDDHLYSESQDFLWTGRVLEEGHGIPSMSMEDPHEKKDLAALLSFKKHIRSDPSGKLSNWTAENSKEVCSWYGISCRKQTRRVVAINLHMDSAPELEGTLSPSLGNLSLMNKLDLSGNNLTGEIPPEFGQLKALRFLDLSENFFVGGSIPPEFGQLKALRFLDLSYNSFLEDQFQKHCAIAHALHGSDFQIATSQGQYQHRLVVLSSWKISTCPRIIWVELFQLLSATAHLSENSR